MLPTAWRSPERAAAPCYAQDGSVSARMLAYSTNSGTHWRFMHHSVELLVSGNGKVNASHRGVLCHDVLVCCRYIACLVLAAALGAVDREIARNDYGE